MNEPAIATVKIRFTPLKIIQKLTYKIPRSLGNTAFGYLF
jgi:hypothetical protein